MKRLPNGILLFLGFAVLLGCQEAPEVDTGQEMMAADTVRMPASDTAMHEPTTPPPADTTITITRVDGQIVVEPDSLFIGRGRVVRWAATDPDAVWLVLFADSTAMQNGVHVLHNTGKGNPHQGPVRTDPETGSQYKYWVFYPDGQGGYLQLDPKLVIVDN